MLESAPDRPAIGSALGEHFEGCEDCRRAFARMCRTQAALRALTPRPAPFELDGLAVAATQAGQRQERALAHLRTALRHGAPAPLDARVGESVGSGLLADVPRVAAPAVLARLVEEELRDPQHALTRRYVSRLQRMGPPASLRDRVQRALGIQRRRASRGAWLGAAALLVLVASIWGWWNFERAGLRPRYQVVYVDDVSELEPLARAMLMGATGGWSELQGKAR
jgi:hypothetical protein